MYLSLALVITLLGLLIAGWQVWLQLFNTQHTLSCSLGLFELLASNGLPVALQELFSPNLECSDVSFKLVWLTIAQWSFVTFLGLTIINIIVILQVLKKKVGSIKIPLYVAIKVFCPTLKSFALSVEPYILVKIHSFGACDSSMSHNTRLTNQSFDAITKTVIFLCDKFL